MSVVKLSWKDGSTSYIETEDTFSWDTRNLLNAMEKAQLDVSELKESLQIRLTLKPRSIVDGHVEKDVILLRYGITDQECLEIPVDQFG